MNTPEQHAGRLTAPELSLLNLQKELQQLHGRRHRTLRSLVFAKGGSDLGDNLKVEIEGEPVSFEVRQVDSELELRLRLTKDESERIVYLVPFARSLPRDIEAQFAGGRVRWPKAESQLPTRFGARSATSRFFASKLRRLAQLDASTQYAEAHRGSIDLDDAWLLFLRWHIGASGNEPTLAQVFSAALLDNQGRSQKLAALLGKVPEARNEMAVVLQRHLGPCGRVVVDAWLDGKADLLYAAALVGEAASDVLKQEATGAYGDLMMVLETAIKQVLGHPLRPTLDRHKRQGLAEALVDLGLQVPLVWSSIGRREDRKVFGALAEDLLATSEARHAALASNRLPFVFELRVTGFLEAIDKAVTSAAKGEVVPVSEVFDASEMGIALKRHEQAGEEAGLHEQIDMALRLTAFLAEPPIPPSQFPTHELTLLAEFQAERGGYVDLARQIVRANAAGCLGKGLLGLVAQVDARRDELDQRFAAAYVSLVNQRGGRKNLSGVVLIEDVLQRFALDVLERQPELRLLILCMDGMSWTNLVELWDSVARRHRDLVPLTLPGQSEGERPLPVLAQVPTLTQLSRTALFAGRQLEPGESQNTSKDGERLAAHLGVKKLGHKPQVFLKSDIITVGGGLSDDASALIRGDNPVVGVVVNAIDDQLKGSAQLRVPYNAESITPLNALIDAALNNGRLILLCSDHGNIPSQRFPGTSSSSVKKFEGQSGGSRWRYVEPNEEVKAGEIEVPAGPLILPDGARAIAVATDETTRHKSMLTAGVHGGLTLAEAIAPAVLLAPRALVELVTEAGAQAPAETELAPPAFWQISLNKWEPGKTAKRPARKVAPKRTKPKNQEPTLPLFGNQESAQERADHHGQTVSTVFRSKLFRATCTNVPERKIKRAQQALLCLLQNGGRMSRSQFGSEMRMLSQRVTGYVAELSELFNVDQELVVSMDSEKTQVVLDVNLLTQIFMESSGG